METSIRPLVEAFVNQIVAAVEADSVRRVQQAVNGALPGRAGRATSGSGHSRPKQLCPVPGCTGVAAPVFGMVCAKHKDMPKAKIKEFRAQRRAAKAAKN